METIGRVLEQGDLWLKGSGLRLWGGKVLLPPTGPHGTIYFFVKVSERKRISCVEALALML